ncbi:MAG: SLBB domain-containing protein, partial [Balneolaceae bacterium]
LANSPTLKSLLERASVRPEAKTDQIFIERLQPDKSIRMITVRLTELMQSDEDLELQREDRIIIYDQQRYRNVEQISVVGEVRNPFERTLPFDERISIQDAIELAGGLEPTANDRAYLQRRDLFNPEKVEVIAIDLAQQQDFPLRPGDLLRVYDQQTFTDTEVVQVIGNVRNNYEIRLEYGNTIPLGDLLFMAGGLEPTAAQIGYVFRKDLFNPEFVQHIPVNITEDLDFDLQPGDQLRVYDQGNYTDPGELSVQGAVNNPINLPFDPTLSVTDLLRIAGGTIRGAATDRVDVFRKNLSMVKGIEYSVISVTIDDSLNVISPSQSFQLAPFDQIIVRRIPQYNLGSSV